MQHGADTPALNRRFGGHPQHTHAAMIGRQQAQQHRDSGRLARAVWPQQRHRLALANLQVEVIDRAQIAEVFGKPLKAHGADIVHGVLHRVMGGALSRCY